MNANLHPALAAALLPLAPPQSVVHKIVQNSDWLKDLHALDARERREMRAAVRMQNDRARATGGVL